MREMNRTMWRRVEGKPDTWESIPADVPETWERKIDELTGEIKYESGEYTIERVKYSSDSTFTFYVHRQTVYLPNAFYGRLRDAKERARKNARGEDTINLA